MTQWKKGWSRLLVLLAAVLSTQGVLASDWKNYDAKAYGFAMLVPDGAAVAEREWGGGWGGIYAAFEGVKLYGRARLGEKESDADIERYGVGVIGIPASQWTMIDSGAGHNGWGRYRTFSAASGGRLFFGGYGVGPKGNYLLYMETTAADFNEHKSDYTKWYESIRLE